MTAIADASYKITEEMKDRVLEVLDGVHTIARADMMQQVGYVSETVTNPRRKKNICGGRQACFIGSLWLAAGIKPRVHPSYITLPGVTQGQRGRFVARKPVLRHALHFLNEAADEYMREHRIRGNESMWQDSVEALFESHSQKLWGGNRRAAMLKVISAAKRKVRAA